MKPPPIPKLHCTGPCNRDLEPPYFTPAMVKRPGKSKVCRSCMQADNEQRRRKDGRRPLAEVTGFRDRKIQLSGTS